MEMVLLKEKHFEVTEENKQNNAEQRENKDSTRKILKRGSTL